MRKRFNFTFVDAKSGAAILETPANLETINYLLSLLHIVVIKGFLADNFWHLGLIWQGIEMIVRFGDDEVKALNVSDVQFGAVVHGIFTTLAGMYAQNILATEFGKASPAIVTP